MRQNTQALFFKATFVLLLLCALLFASLPISAVEPIPSTDGAASVYLWNAEHDAVLAKKTSNAKIYPASMTKMMTGLVAIELVGSRLDEKVTLTDEMLADKKGTSMQLVVGETVSFRDLLYGAVCGGFNDAANALAVASAGNMAAFVNRMNEKARELGALDTHYTNPTGWHSESMVTTLDDTAIIAKAAMKNELYVTLSSAVSYTVEKTNKSEAFTVHNRNGLIGSHYAYGYYNKRAKGLIAGMTDEGGYCVATFVEYDGLTFLCIVMGGEEQNGVIRSYDIANSLLNHAIYYYGNIDVIDKGKYVAEIPVRLALSTEDDGSYMLDCSVPCDVSVFAPYDSASLESIELRPYFYKDELTAPIKKGEVVGGVDIFVDGILRGNADLCASEDVEANGFLLAMETAKEIFTSRGFFIFLGAFVILFCVYFYKVELGALRKKNKKIRYDRLY